MNIRLLLFLLVSLVAAVQYSVTMDPLIPSSALQSELQDAIARGDSARVKTLLERYANPNARSGQYYDESILHDAVRSGNDELVQLLLAYGAHPDGRTREQEQLPIELALKNDYKDIARSLLMYGASIPEKLRNKLIRHTIISKLAYMTLYYPQELFVDELKSFLLQPRNRTISLAAWSQALALAASQGILDRVDILVSYLGEIVSNQFSSSAELATAYNSLGDIIAIVRTVATRPLVPARTHLSYEQAVIYNTILQRLVDAYQYLDMRAGERLSQELAHGPSRLSLESLPAAHRPLSSTKIA